MSRKPKPIASIQQEISARKREWQDLLLRISALPDPAYLSVLGDIEDSAKTEIEAREQEIEERNEEEMSGRSAKTEPR